MIGVLALQGAFESHQQRLTELGVASRQVRASRDLAGIDALVMPGGESTTMSKLLTTSELFEPIAELLANGLPVFGTCAGLILLARDVSDGRVKVLKKCLRGGGEDELYDEIKAHALGELCCRLFRQAVKMAKVAFAPRVIYKLTQRENRPKILCEELLTDGDDFVKQRLSLFAPRDATPASKVLCFESLMNTDMPHNDNEISQGVLH